MKSNIKKIFRLFKRYPRSILALFFVAASSYFLFTFITFANKWIKTTLFSYSTVDIICTNFYSPQIKHKIVSFIQSYVSDANYLSFHAVNFYSNLKEHFTCVTKVTITKRLPVGSCIQIKGVDPIMRINNSYILAADRSIYKNDDFKKFAGLDILPHIAIPMITPGMKITSTTYENLQKLAITYDKDYACTYYNPTFIRLVPRHQTRYASICASESIFDKGVNPQVLDHVIDDLLRRGLCTQKALDKKVRSIELDLRFEQRIIVKMIDHGKRGRV